MQTAHRQENVLKMELGVAKISFAKVKIFIANITQFFFQHRLKVLSKNEKFFFLPLHACM